MPDPPVYLSTVSLLRPLAAGELRVADLPSRVAAAGFDGLEISDRQLVEGDLVALRAAELPLVIDLSVELTTADRERRNAELEYVRGWLPRAAALGARIVRLTVGGQGLSLQRLIGRRRGHGSSPRRRWLQAPWIARLAHGVRRHGPVRLADADGKRRRAVEALRKLAAAAEREGVRLAVENHWGITTDPVTLARIVVETASPHVGTCADLANFPARIDRYAGLAALAPSTVHVHARAARFGPGGEERDIDYPRCLRILADAGYTGAYSVEYTGPGDPWQGALRTRDLIRGDAGTRTERG